MNRIKEVLKEKGISQTWPSKQTGKSYTTINDTKEDVHISRNKKGINGYSTNR